MKQKLPIKNKATTLLEKALEERGIKKGSKPKVKASIPKPGKKDEKN